MKALCTETKLRKLRVLLVDYYAVKVNSWYTIKTLLPNGRQIFYYSIMYSIEDMRRLTWRLKEETLWKRGLLLYLRELQVFLVYEERRYKRPIYYHIELRYTTDTLS